MTTVLQGNILDWSSVKTRLTEGTIVNDLNAIHKHMIKEGVVQTVVDNTLPNIDSAGKQPDSRSTREKLFVLVCALFVLVALFILVFLIIAFNAMFPAEELLIPLGGAFIFLDIFALVLAPWKLKKHILIGVCILSLVSFVLMFLLQLFLPDNASLEIISYAVGILVILEIVAISIVIVSYLKTKDSPDQVWKSLFALLTYTLFVVVSIPLSAITSQIFAKFLEQTLHIKIIN